jgi:hypothetical protein
MAKKKCLNISTDTLIVFIYICMNFLLVNLNLYDHLGVINHNHGSIPSILQYIEGFYSVANL